MAVRGERNNVMKLAVQITSWVMVVLALLGFTATEGDTNTIIGLTLILGQAIVTLVYIKQQGGK